MLYSNPFDMQIVGARVLDNDIVIIEVGEPDKKKVRRRYIAAIPGLEKLEEVSYPVPLEQVAHAKCVPLVHASVHGFDIILKEHESTVLEKLKKAKAKIKRIPVE